MHGFTKTVVLAAVGIVIPTCCAQDHVATLVESHETQLFDGGQFVRITLSASFDPDFADLFASIRLNIVANEEVDFRPLIIFDHHRVVYEPPGTYRNVFLHQFHFPAIGALGDESNPLPICQLEFFSRDLSVRELTIEIHVIYQYSLYEDADTAETILLAPGQYPNRFFWTIPIGVPCRADLDEDGELTIFDFLAFQNAFSAGDLAADFDGDGELTIFDFLAFQNEFDEGCE